MELLDCLNTCWLYRCSFTFKSFIQRDKFISVTQLSSLGLELWSAVELLSLKPPWWACRDVLSTHLALEHHFQAAERHVGLVRVRCVALWCVLHFHLHDLRAEVCVGRVCRSWWSVCWWSARTLVGREGLFSLPALFQCAQSAGVQSHAFHGLEEKSRALRVRIYQITSKNLERKFLHVIPKELRK